MIDFKIALLSDPADLSMSEQHLMSLMKKAHCVEDDVSAIMEEEWCMTGLVCLLSRVKMSCPSGQLSDLRMVIQDLLKSAKSKVKLQPFYTACLLC